MPAEKTFDLTSSPTYNAPRRSVLIGTNVLLLGLIGYSTDRKRRIRHARIVSAVERVGVDFAKRRWAKGVSMDQET